MWKRYLAGLILGLTVTQLSAQVVSTSAMRESAEQSILNNLRELKKEWAVSTALKREGRASRPAVPSPLPMEQALSLKTEACASLGLQPSPSVDHFINLFTGAHRLEAEAALGMAEVYGPMIEQELDKRGLPKDLKYLPLALSAMNPRAVTSQGGSGLWNLSFPVARALGLEVNGAWDERRDPELSTRAALDWLKELHGRYGRMEHALIAFVAGPAGLQSAMRRADSDEFAAIYPHIPESARDYLPAMAAMVYLGRNQEALGLEPLKLDIIQFPGVAKVDREIDLRAVSDVLGLDIGNLRTLNPGIRGNSAPACCDAHGICLPQDQCEAFRMHFSEIAERSDSVYKPKEAKPIVVKADPGPVVPAGTDAVSYTIKSGDNLGLIASWFNVRVSQLRSWNDLRNDRIVAGKKLTVYVPKGKVKYYSRIDAMSFEQKQNSIGLEVKPEPQKEQASSSGAGSEYTGAYTIYTVKSGDNLWSIARNFPGVSAENIQKANNIGTDLQPGQKLKIPKNP